MTVVSTRVGFYNRSSGQQGDDLEKFRVDRSPASKMRILHRALTRQRALRVCSFVYQQVRDLSHPLVLKETIKCGTAIPQAELIALASGLFGEVYNTHSMLEQLNEDVVQVRFHQDNDGILKILKAGYIRQSFDIAERCIV